jgi:hypothetical protein
MLCCGVVMQGTPWVCACVLLRVDRCVEFTTAVLHLQKNLGSGDTAVVDSACRGAVGCMHM